MIRPTQLKNSHDNFVINKAYYVYHLKQIDALAQAHQSVTGSNQLDGFLTVNIETIFLDYNMQAFRLPVTKYCFFLPFSKYVDLADFAYICIFTKM